MISAEDVRRLVEAEAGSVMVFVEGQVRVIGPDEADDLRGAMRVATRADIVGTKPSEHEYEEIAAKLSSMVSTLGA